MKECQSLRPYRKTCKSRRDCFKLASFRLLTHKVCNVDREYRLGLGRFRSVGIRGVCSYKFISPTLGAGVSLSGDVLTTQSKRLKHDRLTTKESNSIVDKPVVLVETGKRSSGRINLFNNAVKRNIDSEFFLFRFNRMNRRCSAPDSKVFQKDSNNKLIIKN